MSILDGVSRVLLVHAHPDDESISTGALAAELASRGVHVALLTLTRGEAGEIVPGTIGEDDDLVAAREHELAGAVDALGISAAYLLGTPPARASLDGEAEAVAYRDSGMVWLENGYAGMPDDVPRGALAAADPDEVAADVIALIGHERPDLVVSYDDIGGYGHPDHVATRQAALAAARAAGVPYAEVRREPGDGVEWLDLRDRREAVVAALRHHASQVTVEGDELVHVGGQREPIPLAVGLRAL